jgi:hypothetical protein
VVIDIGTGSGSNVLRRAAREPRTLFIGIDSDASAMTDASRRAARPARRGGSANVIFLATGAETLPGPLAQSADEVTVVLPWGSLLAAVLEPSSRTLAGIGACLNETGSLRVIVSAQERDTRVGEVLDERRAAALALEYESAGYRVLEARAATRADVDAMSSGWGRRLGIPERRPAWLFELSRRAAT